MARRAEEQWLLPVAVGTRRVDTVTGYPGGTFTAMPALWRDLGAAIRRVRSTRC